MDHLSGKLYTRLWLDEALMWIESTWPVRWLLLHAAVNAGAVTAVEALERSEPSEAAGMAHDKIRPTDDHTREPKDADTAGEGRGDVLLTMFVIDSIRLCICKQTQ